MNSKPRLPPVGVARIVDRVRDGLRGVTRRLAPPAATMLDLLMGGWMTQAVCAAAQLRIADALRKGPLSAEAIAVKVGANADAVQRLMRLLASHGIFRQQRDGRFALTAMAESLRSDSPTSVRGFALFVGSPQHREHWSRLLDSVKSGEVSVPLVRGMPFFDYLQQDRAFGEIFDQAMTSVSDLAKVPVVAAYDFARFGTIVDVGGGNGRLLSAILQGAPATRGVLFDLPAVTAGAPLVLKGSGVTARCRIESGSFFDAVPAGGDAYLLKHIIHDWEESKALAILRNVRNAIGADGTLLLVEMVLPEGNAPHVGKLLDMEMLLSVGGRERTAKEYAQLLAAAGFRQARVVPTVAPVSIIEAVPA
jgi:sulfur carrier protein ThiS